MIKSFKKCVFALMLAVPATMAFSQQLPDLRGKTITLVTYGGSLEQGLKAGIVEPFEKATGARVIMDSPNPKAKLKAMVEARNPTWDVYTEDAAYISEYCGTLFDTVDTSKFVNAGMDKRFVNDQCGVPGAIVGYDFTYDTDKYKNDPPKTWADFFDLKKYPGKRAIPDTVMNGTLEIALLADGVPPEKLYPLDVDRALRKLDSIKSSIVWIQSAGGLTDALVNHQVDLALAYSGRVYAAAKAGAHVDIVRSLRVVTYDQYAVVKGSKNKAAAEAFLDFMAQPEQQAKMTELRASGSANLKSKPQLDDLVKKFVPSPTGSVVQNENWWAKNYDTVSQRYVAWQSE